MTSSYRTKQLIVEGEQDKRVIPYLMEANGITWEKDKHPIDIEKYGGDGFINPYRISSRKKLKMMKQE